MAKFKQCVCPICGSLVFNLIPHPSALIQPDEEVSKILEEICRYNSQNMVGWFGIFKVYMLYLLEFHILCGYFLGLFHLASQM